jgi:hypothetical protein
MVLVPLGISLLQPGVVMGHHRASSEVLEESPGDVSLTMKDANHVNAALDRPEENQVITNGEHPQAWREIKTGLPHEGHSGQPVQGFADTVQHTVCVCGAVLGDVAPDINQISLGARAFEYLGHVTPAPTVPTPDGRDV